MTLAEQRSRTRFYVWLDQRTGRIESYWREIPPTVADYVDATDMKDGEFEALVTSLTAPADAAEFAEIDAADKRFPLE